MERILPTSLSSSIRSEEVSDNESIRLLLVERCKLVRRAIQRIVNGLPCVKSIVEVDRISKTPQTLKGMLPDVMFLGSSTPLKDCLDLTKFVKQRYPQVGIVALMTESTPEVALLLIKSGVDGILDEAATEQDLETAIRASAIGNAFHSRRIHEQIKSSPEKIDLLTVSEMQALSLLMQGDTNYIIARKLEVTVKTVEAHLTRIYRKLAVNSRSQAILRAQELHLT